MTNVKITVRAKEIKLPIANATVHIEKCTTATGKKFDTFTEVQTDDNGIIEIGLDAGKYKFSTEAFEISADPITQEISDDKTTILLEPELGEINILIGISPSEYAVNGEITTISVEEGFLGTNPSFNWQATVGEIVNSDSSNSNAFWQPLAGNQTVTVTIIDANKASISNERSVQVFRSAGGPLSGESASVSLNRSEVPQTKDQMLWVAIRNRTKAISFSGSGYEDFINAVLCPPVADLNGNSSYNRLARKRDELYDPIHGVGAYELLKTATQVFLLMECGTSIEELDRYTDDKLFDADEEARRTGQNISLDEARNRLAQYLGEGQLPYITRVLNTNFKGRNEDDGIFCDGVIGSRANCPPLLELIWSFWNEQSMLVQTMNVLSLRFQNRRSGNGRDPLAHLEIAPLHPLNNLLWGYIQDESNSLSVSRRNYEYNHQYGLSLEGTAVANFRPADTRTRFIEAFHNLLHQTTSFYKQDDDTTFLADAFPLLNSLREVHLILSEGAHNQFGDLPWTARAEMLMQQWLLSRPELREFLQSRAMVPYRESWMPQVDTMKQIQGWTDVSVTHFNYLATYGEQILLSIRYGDWVDVTDPTLAANWARYFRPEIQNYIHSYRAVTGADLAADGNNNHQAELRTMQPSVLLKRRLENKQASSKPVRTNGTSATTSRFRKRRAGRAVKSGAA